MVRTSPPWRPLGSPWLALACPITHSWWACTVFRFSNLLKNSKEVFMSSRNWQLICFTENIAAVFLTHNRVTAVMFSVGVLNLDADSLSCFRRVPQPGHSLQGVHPPTPSCSTTPGPHHQRAACSTYSTHLFSHAISGSTFLKKRLAFFHKKVYNTMKEYKGLYWRLRDCYKGKICCLDYIQYIICFLFFVYDCKLCAYHHL